MKHKKTVSALLIFSLIFPLGALNAKGSGKTTVVVVPVHNNSSDEDADRAADQLRTLLSKDRTLNIIDKAKIDSVLRYYDRNEDGGISTNTDELLAKAKDSYYRFNYIEAKSLVQRAISDIQKSGSVFDYGKSLIDAYLVLGIILRSMGNIGEARQAFREALRLDPEFKLDSRAFPPSMVNVFEGVRESEKIRPRGNLRVESRPRVADVYLNGVMKGVTPVTINNLPTGTHYVKISANKYDTIKKTVEIKEGKSVRISERLQWMGGEHEKLTGKNYATSVNDFNQVDEALKIADLLKVDRVILVGAGVGSGSSGVVTARMVDSKYHTGYQPVVRSYGKGGSDVNAALSEVSKELTSQMNVNILNNPKKYSSPPGSGDPVLMSTKKRSKISKPVLYGVIGGVLAAGLGAGLAAAFAAGSGGGGSGGSGTGNVNVTFR